MRKSETSAMIILLEEGDNARVAAFLSEVHGRLAPKTPFFAFGHNISVAPPPEQQFGHLGLASVYGKHERAR